MTRPPRGLTADEAALWARLAHSVTPLPGKRRPPLSTAPASLVPLRPSPAPPPATTRQAASKLAPPPAPPPPLAASLDASWDRKLARGALAPDFTLDLHGYSLDSAYARLMDGMAEARLVGARVVLVIAGKPRPVEAADRGAARGAIRAKLLDWLAASSHGAAIAAIRKAHLRHGGEGALYVILKKGA